MNNETQKPAEMSEEEKQRARRIVLESIGEGESEQAPVVVTTPVEPFTSIENKNPVSEKPVAKETMPRKKMNFKFHVSKKVLSRIYLGAVAVLLLIILGTGIALYGFGVHDAFVDVVAEIVPFPIGFVGYHPLFLSSYNDDVVALRHFYEAEQTGSGTPAPADSVIRKIAKDNLVRRAMTNELAEQYGVHATTRDVDKAYAALVAQAKSEDQVKSAIQTLWGWDAATYRRKVLQPFVLKQKLADVLKSDPVIGREITGSDAQTIDVYLDRLSQNQIHFWYTVGE